jgi:hypothetical protein
MRHIDRTFPVARTAFCVGLPDRRLTNRDSRAARANPLSAFSRIHVNKNERAAVDLNAETLRGGIAPTRARRGMRAARACSAGQRAAIGTTLRCDTPL